MSGVTMLLNNTDPYRNNEYLLHVTRCDQWLVTVTSESLQHYIELMSNSLTVLIVTSVNIVSYLCPDFNDQQYIYICILPQEGSVDWVWNFILDLWDWKHKAYRLFPALSAASHGLHERIICSVVIIMSQLSSWKISIALRLTKGPLGCQWTCKTGSLSEHLVVTHFGHLWMCKKS